MRNALGIAVFASFVFGCANGVLGSGGELSGGGGGHGGPAAGDVDIDADTDGDGDADGDSDGGSGGDCPGIEVPHGAIGAASDVPLGNGGGDFALAWWAEIDVLNGMDMDAAKVIPLASDLDGDGDLDIAMNPRKMTTAVVLEGDGDGTFRTPVHMLPTELFSTGWGGDLGDVDGDGRIDFLVGDHGTGAHAWTNGGGFAFSPSDGGLPDGTFSGGGLGDMNGDGSLDAVFGADQFGDGLSVAFGNGAGGWTAQSPGGLPALSSGSGVQNVGYFAFADAESDGDLDLFAFGMGLTAYVYVNDGAGSSWSQAASIRQGASNTIGNPVQGSVGDVDADGRVDVAAGGSIATAAGGYGISRTLDDALISHFADMNGDCALDLVTNGPSGLQLHQGDGAGGFERADVGLPSGSDFPADMRPSSAGATFTIGSAYGVEIGDFDGNGELDIVRTYQVEEEGGEGGGFGGMTDAAQHNVLEVWVR